MSLWDLLLGVIMGDANSAMQIGKEGAGLLGALNYTRQFEEQADAEGMRLILAAGIDPQGMISFFEKIQKEDGNTAAIPAYFSTHPSPESRIERLKILAGESGNQGFQSLPPYVWKKNPGDLREETGSDPAGSLKYGSEIQRAPAEMIGRLISRAGAKNENGCGQV